MKALSFSQPWLWSILHGGKRVENRSWAPPIAFIDQVFCLHAAKSWDDAGTPFLFKMGLGDRMPGRKDMYPKAAIVGTARVDRVVTEARSIKDESQRGWFFGEFGWLLCDVVAFATPIPCNGKLGLWTVPDDILASVNAEIRSVPHNT